MSASASQNADRQAVVRRGVFIAGFRDAWPVALTFLFMNTAIGAAGDAAGLSVLQGVFMTMGIFAAPAQIAAIDLIGSGATIMAIVTVAIINARFALMSASLTPRLGLVRFPKLVAGLSLLTASTFAITYGRIGTRRVTFPFVYFLGVGACSLSGATLGTVIGHLVVPDMPDAAEGLLMMLLPVYFVTFLSRVWPRARFVAAGACGAVLTPVIESLLPGFGLMGAAMVVGLVFLVTEPTGRRGRA